MYYNSSHLKQREINSWVRFQAELQNFRVTNAHWKDAHSHMERDMETPTHAAPLADTRPCWHRLAVSFQPIQISAQCLHPREALPDIPVQNGIFILLPPTVLTQPIYHTTTMRYLFACLIYA